MSLIQLFLLLFCILGTVNSVRIVKQGLQTILCGQSNLTDQANDSDSVIHSELIDRIDCMQNKLDSTQKQLDLQLQSQSTQKNQIAGRYKRIVFNGKAGDGFEFVLATS